VGLPGRRRPTDVRRPADLGDHRPRPGGGVTLRVYDLQKNLTKLCTLKSAPDAEHRQEDVGHRLQDHRRLRLDNQFASETLANVNITTAGEYTFRLLATTVHA
jgi:hypothetical protein